MDGYLFKKIILEKQYRETTGKRFFLIFMDSNKEKTLLNNLFAKGQLYLKKNNPKQAIINFKKILAFRPKNPQVLNLIGIAFHQKSDFDKAVYYATKAIKFETKEIGFHINLGNIFKDMKNFSASLKAYDDALKINKNSVDALYNMGVLFTEQNDHAHAVTYYEKVIQLNRNHKYSLDNLGNSYTELSRFDEAIASYNKAISIDPNFIQAQFNLGLLLLLTNSLKLGWEQYEYRLKKESYIKNRPFLNYKYWDGSNLDNKKLLIYCEQGIGDSVQFSRYIKNIKKNNTLIILLCSNTLKVLYKHFIEIDLIITSNKDAPEIDYYVSIMSLPYIFRNKKIPETYRFIKANKKLSINWQSKISSTTKMKIGLVWQGGINHASDYKRSIALNKFNPILCLKDFEFISLQKDFGREQIKSNKLKGYITDFSDDIKTFQETIALIENLDLVISVDTAIAHIAATMGKETWILLPFVPDFRWGLNQSTTSWYKTVKLFRQKKTNQWEQVIKEVKKKLLQKI